MAVIYTSTTYTKGCSNDSNKFNYYLTVDELSQDIANNQRDIKLSLWFYPSSVSNTLRWDTAKAYAPTSSITVDDIAYQSDINAGSASGDYYLDDGYFRRYVRKAAHVLIAEKTLTITNNNDGSKSITVRFNWFAGSGSTTVYYPASFTSNTVEIQLPTMPRASSVTCPTNEITISSTSGSLSYTVTSQADWWHKLSYTLDGATTNIWSSPVRINETSRSGSIAYSTLLNKLTTAPNGNLVLTVSTYSDSAATNLIGTKSFTVAVAIDTATFKPVCSLTQIAVKSSPISGYLIAGYSDARISFTATKPTGATSVTTYVSISRGTLVSGSASGTSGTVDTNILPASATDYTFTVTAYAKDSRGVVSSSVSLVSGTVYGYVPPVITASAYRVANNTATTEDASGLVAYVTFSSEVSSSINNQNTIQTLVCTYSGSHSGTATSGSHIALQLEETLTFTITTTDKIGSSTKTLQVNKAILDFHLVDDGTGLHTGMAIAGIAEYDKIKLNKPTYTVTPNSSAVGKEVITADWILARVATQNQAGLMSKEDKTKLDNVTPISIDSALDTTSENAVQNKVIATAINGITNKTIVTNAVSRTRGGTIDGQKLVMINNVVYLYLLISKTSSTASGSNLFEGTINSSYKPAAFATTSGYYSNHIIGAVIKDDGTVIVRNASATAVTASSGVWLSFTYIV